MTNSSDHRIEDSATGKAAADAAETIAREARHVADTAADEAAEFAGKQKSRVQDYLNDVSSALTDGGQTLHQGGHETSAHMVKHLAAELHGAAQEIEGRTPTELLQEVEEFARRRPALFFGAALLAGFGAVRFVKSAEKTSVSSSPQTRR